MNQAEFAKLHGVSRKTVTAWKARGWLVLDGEDIDVDASNERIRRYRKTVTRTKNKQKGNTKSNRVTRQGNTLGNSEGNSDVPCDGLPDVSKEERVEQFIASHGAMMTLDEARTMKENYFALLAKLEYDEKNGTLLPWKPIIERVGAEYTRVRTRLVALAPEHGPRLRALAGMTDDQGFTAALQELIYEALNELAFDRRETNGDTV
ncbi:RNA polymerase subunit sigma-70 [Escherichia coli]|uniref:RNA polymerase subunit sigma-70 n=1 Tax=Escherichia coli TaxID=562 RepID=UPI000C2323D0|nr:RNA polymerase subunit sigma-70 [Escherichia coli]PJI56900.1 RNA polymerase subunit sigma-70 [Escherichia coli]